MECVSGRVSLSWHLDRPMALHQMRALVLDEGLLGPLSSQGPSNLSRGHRASTAKCGFANLFSLRPFAPSPPMTAARTGCPSWGCEIPSPRDPPRHTCHVLEQVSSAGHGTWDETMLSQGSLWALELLSQPGPTCRGRATGWRPSLRLQKLLFG